MCYAYCNTENNERIKYGKYIDLWLDSCLVQQFAILVDGNSEVSVVTVNITDEQANSCRLVNQRVWQNSTDINSLS